MKNAGDSPMTWLPKGRVLVPFDFSDYGTKAITTALELVDNPEHLDVVYVARTPHPAEPIALWGMDAERIDRVREALTKRLAEDNIKISTIHVREGDPGHEIVDLANEVGAELIVMPSHGRKGVKRVLLGSVTERVLRFAHCPVLVLRHN